MNDPRRNECSHDWPDWSVWPGHCEHAEDHEKLETFRVCGWKAGLCAGPCPSCPNNYEQPDLTIRDEQPF